MKNVKNFPELSKSVIESFEELRGPFYKILPELHSRIATKRFIEIYGFEKYFK